LLQNRVDILRENVLDTLLNACQRYLALTAIEEGEKNEFFVGFHVDLVSDIGREGEDQSELFDGVLVSFQARHHQPLVVQVAHDVHGARALRETCCWVVYDLERVLVALGFKAELGELTVERAAHWMVVEALGGALNLSKSCQNWADACDCISMAVQEVICVEGGHKVELLCAIILLLQVEIH
jgi:hypothetical protein